MSLTTKLDKWVTAGLLTNEQAASIIAFEARSATGPSAFVWGISAVGALTVTVGIISLIAANWSEISAPMKLFGLAMLLGGTLFGAHRAQDVLSGWVTDLLLLFHSGMVLAGIGLVGQIFHLSGHPWRAVALATLMAVPPVFAARRSIVTDVPIAFACITLGLFVNEKRYLDGEDFFIVFGAVGLVLFACAALTRRLQHIAAHAFARWSFLLVSTAVVWAATRWAVSYSLGSNDAMSHVYWLFGAAAALAIAVEAALDRFTRPGRVVALVLSAAFVLSVQLLPDAGHTDTGRQLLGFVLFCAICLSTAVAAAQSNSPSTAKLATLALAARVFVLYLELVKDLMTTGIGLVGTGLVFIALAFGWWKLSRSPLMAPHGGQS